MNLDIGQFFGNIQVGSMLDNFLKTFMVIGGFACVIGLFVFLYFKKRNKEKQKNAKQIGWWEEINNRLEPGEMDQAEEIIIPGTSLVVFYIKKKKFWLPRFTRGIKKNLFYITRTRNGEIVNFTIRGIEKDMIDAGLEYDHFDMKFAAENTREFIKRNYKDKSVPWWKEYKEIISTGILLLVITFCFIMIIFFMRDMLKDMGTYLGPISDSLNNIADKFNSCNAVGSGVVKVG